VIVGELLQRAGAQDVGAAVAYVREAHAVIGNPERGERGAHASLFGVLGGGFKYFFIGEVNGAGKALGFGAPAGLCFAKDGQSGIIFAFDAVFDDGFNGQGTGDFAVRFAAHAVGKNEESHVRDNAVAILVIRAHATHVAYAAASDSHTNS